jgi:ribose transport system permease protein
MTQATTTLPAPVPGVTQKHAIQRAVKTYSFGFAALLTVALLITNIVTVHGGFGWSDQLANVAPMAIASLASAPSIIGGGFDLSISPLIGLVNCVFIVYLLPHGLGGALSVPIMLGIGLGVGALNGILIVALRVQPIVVTLAMFFSLQGIDLIIAPNPASASSTGWVRYLAQTVGPVPGAIITIGVPLLIWIGLRFIPFRRLLFAVGSNDATAFSSGVNVNVVRIGSYALGGLFAGFGGLALSGLVSSANASNSTEYTLTAIAAIVLGGTSLAGGRGGLIGPLLGAFSIYLLQNLLATFAINPAYLQIVYGGILIVAVVLGGVLTGEGGGGLRRSGVPFGRLRRTGTSPLTIQALPTRTDQATEPPLAAAQARHARPAGSGAGERAREVWNAVSAFQGRFPAFQVVALIAVFVYGAISLPGLGSWNSIRSILVLSAFVGLASGGQTLLILIGGFDLGVSGFIVAGALTVTALQAKYNIPFGVALLLAVVGSGILGGLAGYICHRFAINPLIVTLAMGTTAVGLVAVQNNGLVNGNAPPWLNTLAEPVTRTWGLPIPPVIAIWIAALIVFAVLLHRTRIGRNLFATGANSRAADYALINTRLVWTATFAFSAVASALVGGTVFGGPGDYTRTCVGAIFLTVLTTVLVGHGASPAAEEIIYGLIILAAIAVYGRQRRLRDRL